MSADVRQERPRLRVTEATSWPQGAISTLSLCNANFSEVSLGNAITEGRRRGRGKR